MNDYFIWYGIEERDDWRACLFMDVETAEDFEWQDKRLSEEDRLNFLNIERAKQLVLGVFKEYNHSKLEQIKGFVAKREVEDMVLYMYKGDKDSLGKAVLEALELTGLKRLVAHNGNRIDFLLLKGLVNLNENKNNVYFYLGKQRIRCIDTFRIASACGKASLNEFAKLFGLEGKDYRDFMSYSFKDVEILMRLAMKLQEQGFMYTPQRSVRYELHKVLKKPVKVQMKADLDLIGGRVQVWKYEAEKGHVYDFNSLYPSVMANLFSVWLKEEEGQWYTQIAKSSEKEFMKDLERARAFINSIVNKFDRRLWLLKQTYPLRYIYFIKAKIKGVKKEYKHLEPILMQYFPFTSEFKSRRVYSFHEDLNYHIHAYEVLFLYLFDFEIVDIYKAIPGKLPFAELYKELYKKRLELKKSGDKRELYYKLLMNSGYGIFGLKNQGKTISGTISMYDAHRILKTVEGRHDIDILSQSNQPLNLQYYDVVERMYVQILQTDFETALIHLDRKSDFSRISCPPIALTTTANARFWLYLHILWLATKGYEVYYCDTDSIHTNATPEVVKPFIGDEMLQLKHELSFEKAMYLLPKTYSLMTGSKVKTKHKGIGEDLSKKMVIQSVKTNFSIIERNFIDLNSKPAYVPDKGRPVLNIQGKKVNEVDEYLKLIDRYKAFVEEAKKKNLVEEIEYVAEDVGI